MPEYIEREELPKKKERGFFPDDDFNAGWNACLNAIASIPAADVRPVVLCRDCKYNNHCLTQAFVEDESRALFNRNTWFCADGERIKNADN